MNSKDVVMQGLTLSKSEFLKLCKTYLGDLPTYDLLLASEVALKCNDGSSLDFTYFLDEDTSEKELDYDYVEIPYGHCYDVFWKGLHVEKLKNPTALSSFTRDSLPSAIDIKLNKEDTIEYFFHLFERRVMNMFVEHFHADQNTLTSFEYKFKFATNKLGDIYTGSPVELMNY